MTFTQLTRNQLLTIKGGSDTLADEQLLRTSVSIAPQEQSTQSVAPPTIITDSDSDTDSEGNRGSGRP